MAKRLVGLGLGAGLCLALGALPAHAVTLGPVTVPSLPPVQVAPGPITVGPVAVDPSASVSPDGAHVGVATGGLPLPDGGPDVGLNLGNDGAQVGVGGVGAGVVLSPPPAIAPPAPDGAPDPSAGAVVATPNASSSSAGTPLVSSASPRAPGSATAAQPKVVALSNGAPVAVTGGVDAPRSRNWWSLATGAARSLVLWIVLVLAAFVVRNRVGAALRDQRGVKVARSA